MILHLIARSRKAKIVDRFIDALGQIEGGYALVAQTRYKMIGARDPLGIRPLVLGKVGEAWVLASETCALDTIGATFVRDVEHGEVVVIDEEGLTSIKPFAARAARPCLFEYVYFARPDSVVNGLSVYDVRKEMGRRLAREHKVEADIVVPVPDSGVPAALGYAQESGLPSAKYFQKTVSKEILSRPQRTCNGYPRAGAAPDPSGRRRRLPCERPPAVRGRISCKKPAGKGRAGRSGQLC